MYCFLSSVVARIMSVLPEKVLLFRSFVRAEKTRSVTYSTDLELG